MLLTQHRPLTNNPTGLECGHWLPQILAGVPSLSARALRSSSATNSPAAIAVQRERREGEFCELRDWWCTETGRDRIGLQDVNWLRGALLTTAAEEIRYAMEVALSRGYDRDFRYVAGILRNRRQQGGE
jgi:uncharacterized protein (DUF2342 family)